MKRNKLNNNNEIENIYTNSKIAKQYLKEKDNINIINNLDKFISYFKNEFEIDNYELCFITSILFECPYFIQCLTKNLDYIAFKSIIVNRICSILSAASGESKEINLLVKKTKLKINNYQECIDNNYIIIKKIFEKKAIKFNYCYLFDDIKYFNDDLAKKENYFYFIKTILTDYLIGQKPK